MTEFRIGDVVRWVGETYDEGEFDVVGIVTGFDDGIGPPLGYPRVRWADGYIGVADPKALKKVSDD